MITASTSRKLPNVSWPIDSENDRVIGEFRRQFRGHVIEAGLQSVVIYDVIRAMGNMLKSMTEAGQICRISGLGPALGVVSGHRAIGARCHNRDSGCGGGRPRRTGWRNSPGPPACRFHPDNPYSPEKAELGRMLFFDPLMSASGTISCATCHHPRLAWADGLPRAVGEARTPCRCARPLCWGPPGLRVLAGTASFRRWKAWPSPRSARPPIWAATSRNCSATSPRDADLPRGFRPAVSRRRRVALNRGAGAGDLSAHHRAGASAVRPLDIGRRGRHFRQPPNAASTCSPGGRDAANATPPGASPTIPSATSGAAATTTSAAGGCSRIRRRYSTPSRCRRYAMSPSARPTCTMARCRHWKA